MSGTGCKCQCGKEWCDRCEEFVDVKTHECFSKKENIKNKNKYFCVDCGKEVYRLSKRCRSCATIFINKEKLTAWKGEKAGKQAKHIWIRKNKPKPKFCERCGQKSPYDLAKKEGKKYTRNIDNYEWLCRKCHMKGDKRLENWNKKRHNDVLNGLVKRDGFGRFLN